MNSFEERYEIRSLTEDDFENVWQVMGCDFTDNEPVSAKLKVSVDYPQLILYRSWKIKQGLKQHASIGAYEKSSNKIVGCAILHLSHKTPEEKSPANIDEAPLNFRQLQKFLSSCMDGLTEIMGEDEYMEITFLACHKNHTGHGIATNLFRHAVDIAQQQACKKVFLQTNNYYVQRIATKNGFDYHKEVFYSKYVDPITGTKVLHDMPEPHTKGVILIKNL